MCGRLPTQSERDIIHMYNVHVYIHTCTCVHHIRNLACSYNVVGAHGVHSVMMYMYMCIHTSTWPLQHILVFQLVSHSAAGRPSGSCNYVYTPFDTVLCVHLMEIVHTLLCLCGCCVLFASDTVRVSLIRCMYH